MTPRPHWHCHECQIYATLGSRSLLPVAPRPSGIPPWPETEPPMRIYRPWCLERRPCLVRRRHSNKQALRLVTRQTCRHVSLGNSTLYTAPPPSSESLHSSNARHNHHNLRLPQNPVFAVQCPKPRLDIVIDRHTTLASVCYGASRECGVGKRDEEA